VQHEAQHQETMLQSLDLNAQLAPYPPARPRAGTGPRPPTPVDDRARIHIANGSILVGTDDRTCAYDNERPRHRCDLTAFSIDRYPVTCRRYLEFMDDGGYARPELWSEAGWRWREESGHRAPQGWTWDGRAWWVRRLGHRLALDPSTPVQHVCYHEAQAFARWDGGRLPTEPEWEAAARAGTGEDAPAHPWGDAAASGERANLGQTAWGPCPVGSYPAGASPAGVEQLLGDVYEWTSSRFTGYPGFESFPYREYSEVFFGDDYRVLRGASWATSPHCARTTFRNWDYPIRRQIFAGLRVARDT
jgi:gamma-glutamyl hercynylcysteine S-oxide synthase